MKITIVILVVSSAIGNLEAAEQLGSRNGTSKIHKPEETCGSHFDILIKELLSQSWENDRLCLHQILDTIHNAKNATLWATWVWDSMQLPVGLLYGSRNHLGNYDQCLKEKVGSSRLPYSTQFCLAEILLQPATNMSPEMIDPYGSTDAYVKSKTVLEQRFNEMSWGLCVPRVCQTESVEKFARALLKQSHLGYLQSPENVTISCEFPQPEGVNRSTVLLMFVLLTTMTVVACTVVVSSKLTKNPSSFAEGIMRCFCLKTNVKELTQKPKNDVNVLHGMRFISCAMIVLIHMLFGIYTITAANGLDFEEELNSYGQVILNFVIVVDTFFVMSGLLFMRNIKKDSTTRDLINGLIKRYFRLIWWYLANVMIVFFVLPNSGCGPLCSKYVKPEKQNCHRTWWSGLLMIANYYDVYGICAPTSWYIFCDFQISVVASVVFWIYQRHKRAGFACFTVLIMLSVILPGFFGYSAKQISMTPIKFDMYKTMRNHEMAATIMHLYSKAHFRANPYLVGIMMGYIMSNYKPEDIRNFFTKKRLINYVLGFTFVVTAILVVYVNGSDSVRKALLISLHKPFWALLMCILIGVCEYGSFPLVKDVLSWKGFIPLSKLTYGIYMIHFTTIVASLACTRSTLHYSAGILIEKYLAHLVLATLISLFFMLFVESPLNNVVKMILAKRGNTNLETDANAVKNGGTGVIGKNTNDIITNDYTTDSTPPDLKHKLL